MDREATMKLCECFGVTPTDLEMYASPDTNNTDVGITDVHNLMLAHRDFTTTEANLIKLAIEGANNAIKEMPLRDETQRIRFLMQGIAEYAFVIGRLEGIRQERSENKHYLYKENQIEPDD